MFLKSLASAFPEDSYTQGECLEIVSAARQVAGYVREVLERDGEPCRSATLFPPPDGSF